MMKKRNKKNAHKNFELTLPDIFLLLGARERTGELIIEAGNNIGTIFVHQRKILQTFSPYSRAIGDLLVEKGLISESELIETLQIQKKSEHVPLGSLLIKMGKVTLEVVEMMVHEQIRQAVKEFQSWNNATFSFLDADLNPHDRIHLTLNEFIPPSMVASAKTFLSADTRHDPPPTHEPVTTAVNP
jgi:uncharacterized protein DUF4388